MIQSIVFLCLIFSSTMSFAGMVADVSVAAGPTYRMEKSISQRETLTTTGPSVAIGHDMGHLGLVLEFQQYSAASGNSMIGVATKEDIFTLGLVYNVLDPVMESRWTPYAVLSTGLFQDSSRITFNDSVSEDFGMWNTLAMAGIGTWFRFYEKMRVGFELRGEYSQNFTQKFLPSGTLRVGAQF